MRNFPLGAGLSCRTGTSLFPSSAFLLLLSLFFQSVTHAQWTSTGSNTYLTTGTNNVGIGTQTPGAKLEVDGNLLLLATYPLYINSGYIAALQVTVAASLPDYVFNDGYRLLSLDSVDRYIRANHHLPDVPSADSVAKAGLDLGGNQAVLLKKIEELTLYLLQQQPELEELKADNKRMAAKLRARQ